jgi:hypothetical protein
MCGVGKRVGGGERRIGFAEVGEWIVQRTTPSASVARTGCCCGESGGNPEVATWRQDQPSGTAAARLGDAGGHTGASARVAGQWIWRGGNCPSLFFAVVGGSG